MTASVVAIVLNWCNEGETAACLDALLASRYDALTVLLVDNGSPDGSGPRLHERFPDVPYLQTGTNLGYAGGNNRGIDWALAHGAEFILVLNDDTVVDPECVGRLVRAAEETDAAIVAPQITYFDEPDRIWYGGGEFSTKRALGIHLLENEPVPARQDRRPITFVCGCCFLIRAGVVRETGGFDETFFAYVEDAELSFRLVRRGHRLLYEPAATLHHRIKRDAPPTAFQIRQRDRNRRRLVALHYTPFERLQFMLWFYPTRAVHLARYLVRADWTLAKAQLDGAVSRLRPT